MSLINEALKKAQHQRSGPTDLAPMPGGGGAGRRGSGMPKGTLFLMIAGAFVVVVLSVVGTVIFVNRSPTPPAVVAAAPLQPDPVPVPEPAAATPPEPAAEPAAEPAPATDSALAERIADYVDKLRVTGIRTSENGSKVLMNDKVYRANDVVNRALGLKLVKISADSLTFADAAGATYVKNF